MGRNLPHIMATLSSVMPFIHNKDEHSGGKKTNQSCMESRSHWG